MTSPDLEWNVSSSQGDRQPLGLFLGAHGGLEELIVPRHGFHLETLPSLKGGLWGLEFPRQIMRTCRGYLQARRAIMGFKAQAVVGLGGYASALPILAAWGTEVPCLILEQNVIPGRTTRKLAPFANEIGVQFPETSSRLARPGRVKHLGNPLRKKLVEAAASASARNTQLHPAPEEPLLLVLGGSQGARALNEFVVLAWPKLKKILPGLRVILVSGRQDETRAMEAFAAAGVRGQVLPFSESMEDLYAQADVVLARAGATTLAEVAAFALPSILIPYPFATDDHQSANARVFSSAGAAWTLFQKNLECDRLAQRIADTVLQPERRRRMALAAAGLARPQAAAEVVERLERLAGLRSTKLPPIASPPVTPQALIADVA